jgi:formylglycine-generating enzyme required for sulfatase activity
MNTNKKLKRGLVYIFVVLAMLSCKLPFDLLGQGDDAQPIDTLEEIAVVVSTEDEVIPTPTLTSTTTPTVTATPDPISLLPEYMQEAIQWDLAFEDNFADDSNGWFVGEIDDDLWKQSREISDGKYLWTMEFTEDMDEEWVTFGVVPAHMRVSDFEVSLKVKQEAGFAETAYGLSFRHSPTGAYLFTIRNDSFRLAVYDYQDTMAIIDWTPTDLIIAGEMNELKVLTNGDHITLFINDEIVADITDTTLSHGRIMLAFDLSVPGASATLAFDEIQLKTRASTIHQEAQRWPLNFEETFESNQHDWFAGEQSNEFFDASFDFIDGVFHVEAIAKQGFTQPTWPQAQESQSDFYMSVDILSAGSDDGAREGLVFRVANDGYYLYRLIFDESLGKLDVLLKYQNEWFSMMPVQYISNLGISKGDDIQLGVIGVEERFVLLVNDVVIGEFSDPRLPTGRQGLSVGLAETGDRGAFTFTNFKIFTPGDSQQEEIPSVSTPTVEKPAVPTPTVGSQVDTSPSINQKDNANMVYVPEGEFLMGYAGESAEEDEGPERNVFLSSYWFYETPVTNSQYRQCIEAGTCTGTLSRFPNDNYPVTRIDWAQADAYCEWAGGRLPTEAEWEKAARGTDGRLFPWGDQSPSCNLANYQGCYSNQATEVGRFPDGASPYGALDMLGLVWEWVFDWYDDEYYTFGPYENPTGPVTGQLRVQRGHSFESNEIYLRLTDRAYSSPFQGDYRKGFRCVISD